MRLLTCVLLFLLSPIIAAQFSFWCFPFAARYREWDGTWTYQIEAENVDGINSLSDLKMLVRDAMGTVDPETGRYTLHDPGFDLDKFPGQEQRGEYQSWWMTVIHPQDMQKYMSRVLRKHKHIWKDLDEDALWPLLDEDTKKQMDYSNFPK